MSPTLREQLIRTEQHFLLAVVSNDEEALKVFSQEWSQLARDIKNTKATGRLDDDTAHLLSEVSQAIENMAVCVLESGAILQESLTHSIGDLIQDITCGDPSKASLHSQVIAPCRLLFSDLPSTTILGRQELLDSYAYCWLMQNIHDPYPSSVQTQIIGDISGTPAVQVELWFQEFRDSIGWSKLSRDFFAGSVSATVAAARRVYLERDKNISFDIVFAFSAVKTSAETLFSECPSPQGKNVDTELVGPIHTMVVGQGHHMGSAPDEYTINPNSIPVFPQAYFSAPQDPLSDLSDSDDSEEEDTTPPPSIVGFKRLLAEDELVSQVADTRRPQKRHRTWSINRTPSSEPECTPPLPSLGLSSKQATPATLVSPSPPLHPSSSTPTEFSPDPPPSISQKRRYTDDTLECAVGLIHADVSVHGTRKRRLSECVSPGPPKRQRCPSIPSKRHPEANATPPSDECRGRLTNSDEFLQPMLQVPPDIPLSLGVYDWNSISYPLAGAAPLISQPPVFYVPSSDLASQLLEPPDLGYNATIPSRSPSELGLLEDFNSLLQFPMPVEPPPDLSTSFAASSYSADPSLLLRDVDWSTITEFINFPPGSIQSSSPLASSGNPPTPPEDSDLSLSLSHPCDSSEQLLFELDPLVPPSAFLPIGSGDFTEDVDNMWSLLRGDS